MNRNIVEPFKFTERFGYDNTSNSWHYRSVCCLSKLVCLVVVLLRLWNIAVTANRPFRKRHYKIPRIFLNSVSTPVRVFTPVSILRAKKKNTYTNKKQKTKNKKLWVSLSSITNVSKIPFRPMNLDWSLLFVYAHYREPVPLNHYLRVIKWLKPLNSAQYTF